MDTKESGDFPPGCPQEIQGHSGDGGRGEEAFPPSWLPSFNSVEIRSQAQNFKCVLCSCFVVVVCLFVCHLLNICIREEMSEIGHQLEAKDSASAPKAPVA